MSRSSKWSLPFTLKNTKWKAYGYIYTPCSMLDNEHRFIPPKGLNVNIYIVTDIMVSTTILQFLDNSHQNRLLKKSLHKGPETQGQRLKFWVTIILHSWSYSEGLLTYRIQSDTLQLHAILTMILKCSFLVISIYFTDISAHSFILYHIIQVYYCNSLSTMCNI
jgi:hypothetical protein